MSIKPTEMRWLQGPLVDPQTGMASKGFADWLRFSVEAPLAPLVTRDPLTAKGTPNPQTPIGQIRSTSVVQGRTEPVSTTLTNINPTGQFNSLGNVVDTSTDHLTDGTGSPLTGGKRGFQALDANNRITSSFHTNPINVSSAPTSTTILSNTGAATLISVAALTQQFGPGMVNYGAASVDPGSFGTWYMWYVDPTFSGGTLTPQFSSSPVNQTAGDGIVLLGKITTVNGTSKTGGGFSGGTTPGGAGGRGFVQ